MISPKYDDDDANLFKNEEWINEPAMRQILIGKSLTLSRMIHDYLLLYVFLFSFSHWNDFMIGIWCNKQSFDHFINEPQGPFEFDDSISVNLKSSSAPVWSVKNVFMSSSGHKFRLSAVLLIQTPHGVNGYLYLL